VREAACFDPRCFLLSARYAQLVSYYHAHLAISQFQGAILTSATTRTRFFFFPVRGIFVSVRLAVRKKSDLIIPSIISFLATA